MFEVTVEIKNNHGDVFIETFVVDGMTDLKEQVAEFAHEYISFTKLSYTISSFKELAK